MMGTNRSEPELFCYRINLENRVRRDNPLRQIAEKIDFRFVREEVRHLYGNNGNVSVDPEVIMKLMFLLFFDDHKSERALMGIIQERLDYLWFLGLGIDDPIPDHSVLSKARRRWGPELFEEFFKRTVLQACEAGIVDASKLYLDSTLIDANASAEKTQKIHPVLVERIREVYAEEENKLESLDSDSVGIDQEGKDPSPKDKRPGPPSSTFNTTDPDAPLVKRKGLGKAKPRYKNHRAVDAGSGIIVANESSGGDVYDGTRLASLIAQSEANTGIKPQATVGDNHYATIENFRHLGALGITAHLGRRELSGAAAQSEFNEEGERMLTPADFHYDQERDFYVCPAGNELRPGKACKDRDARPYRSRPSQCANCSLAKRCTRAKRPSRTILRYEEQEYIDKAIRQAESPRTQRELRQRMGLGEGSFGEGSRCHGLKRARWRRLSNISIQNNLIAAIQNIKKIVKHCPTPPKKLRIESKSCNVVVQGVFSVLCEEKACHIAPFRLFEPILWLTQVRPKKKRPYPIFTSWPTNPSLPVK